MCGAALAEDGWTYYTTENSGLASDNITCMEVDESGNVWFGHRDGVGISVFDGANWEIMQPYPDGEHYSIDEILFINNEVWAASGSGLFCYSGGKWETVYEDIDVRAITSDKNGNIWIGGRLSTRDSSRFAVSRFDGESWMTWFVDEMPVSMAIDHTDTLWLSCYSKLYSYDGHDWTLKRMPIGNRDLGSFENIVVDEDNTIWFMSNVGVFIYDGSVLKKTGSYANDIAFGPDNIVWLTGYATFAYYSDKPETGYEVDSLYGYDNTEANQADGSIWFSSYSSGCVQYSGPAYPIEDGWSFEFHVDYEISDPFGGYEYSDRKISGYFPLAMGNTWTYQRKYRPVRSNTEYEDTAVMTIIDARDVEGKTEYEFLDGRVYIVNAEGVIENFVYELRPCGEITCGVDNIFYKIHQQRYADSIITKAGAFQGYKFRMGGFHGSGHFLASSVGLVFWQLYSDQGTELLELESAIINGVEIGTSTEVKSTNIPEPLTLTAPYPNPFNTSTTLEFTLSENGESSLSAYSITGQKVRTLLSGNLSAGKYTVVWDGADSEGLTLSSAVYLVRLELSGRSVTRRLAFVK